MAHTSTNRSRHFTWLELNKSNMLYTKNMLKTKTNKKYARKKKNNERVSSKPPVRTLQKPKQAKFGLNKIKTAPELVTYLRVYWYSLQASSSKSFMTENKENYRKLFWCTKYSPSHLIFRHLCLSHLAMKICRGPRDWEPWVSLCARDSSRKHWARSIQPKFRLVRPGKEDHLKRWTSFFETFPVGPNRSIDFWTEISGNLNGSRPLIAVHKKFSLCCITQKQ